MQKQFLCRTFGLGIWGMRARDLLFASLLFTLLSCNHDDALVQESEEADETPFYGLVAYGGEMASDASEDKVDLTDEDMYWEAVGFSKKLVITYSLEGASVQGDPDVKRTVTGADVILQIGENKKVEIVVKGACENGSLKIYGAKKFKLTLSGLDLKSAKGAAVNVQCPKRVFVHLTDGTVNRLRDSSEYVKSADEDMKGSLFAEGDIIFSGTGVLIVEGKGQNAIASDDGIVFRPGVTIAASASALAGKAVRGKDYLDVKGGFLDLTTTGDGFFDEAEQDDKSAACLSSDSTIVIRGGRIRAESRGLAGKGIKSDKDIYIGGDGTEGPDIIVSTFGDRMEGEGYSSSPKAIKADGRIEIRSGRIVIPHCTHEGIESKDPGLASIRITGGEIDLRCTDDCLNSAGGIQIDGGKLFIESTANDGIDSNYRGKGSFVLNDGLVIGLTSLMAHELGIDTDKSPLSIGGGILFTCGRTQNGSTSTPNAITAGQPTALLSKITLTEGQFIAVYDEAGKALFSFRMPFSFTRSYSLLSHPGFEIGKKYFVRTGGSEPSSGESWKGFWNGGDARCETDLCELEFTQNYIKQ